MAGRLWAGQLLVGLVCGWVSTGSAAWWQADPEPQEVHRHLMPTGADFPGLPPADAERISRSLRFALHFRDFARLRLSFPPENRQSTGLYRVPNEPLTINVHKAAGHKARFRDGLWPMLIIGAHNTLPAGADNEGRGPDLAQVTIPLQAGEQTDRADFMTRDRAAGLVYIATRWAGSEAFDITITGAVRAPWFKLGRDTVAHWQEVLRHDPAPWAELEGERAILTLPSAMIRSLEDPRPIIRFYDQIVENAHALVGLSDHASDVRDRAPDLPYRFVLDPALAELRPGVLSRSGYPIWLNWVGFGHPELWLSPGNRAVISALMQKMGHSLRSGAEELEPPGAAQAFASLIDYADQSRRGYSLLAGRSSWMRFFVDALYAYSPVWGATQLWVSSLTHPENYAAAIWVPDRNAAVTQKRAFMIKLVRHLSHDFVARLYSRFRHSPKHLLPAGDDQQQKTDFFFERLCEVTEKDLTPLFENWRVPVSAGALQRVADKGYDIPPWVRHDGL